MDMPLRPATIRRCALPDGTGPGPEIGGRPAVFWQLRELSRFGVEEAVFLGPRAAERRAAAERIAGLLPRPVALPAGADAGGRVLELAEDALPAGNLAAVLAEACRAPEAAARVPAGGPGFVARRPALFLDRDGTINVDHGYVGTPDRFELIPGALEAVAAATARGWHVFVVTNQSGIARGLYGEADFAALMDALAERARQAGGTIDDVRHCPFHPEAPLAAYRRAHDWRKPAPGMLRDLIRAWEPDVAGSVMVGDQPGDMQAAAAAGVRGVLFRGGDLRDCVLPLLG